MKKSIQGKGLRGRKTNALTRTFDVLFTDMTPARRLLFGYGLYVLIGWAILMLPFMHTKPIGAIDDLFTATTAISTTGLATVDIGSTYTFIGQFVIMLLIQVGGLGYMTVASFIVLSRRHSIKHKHKKILYTEFPLPQGFELPHFLKAIIVYTTTVELIGAAALFILFQQHGMGIWQALWSAIFHSVSTFCTAGISTFSDSFMGFADNIWVNIVINLLSLLGAIGFIVAVDVFDFIRRKKNYITMTTKIILWVTFLTITAGAVMFFFESDTNAPIGQRIMESIFQSVSTCSTTGYNSISLSEFTLPAVFMAIILMYIGASPSGTGGGLKSTTITAAYALIWNQLRGNRRFTFFGKTIPLERIHAAASTWIFYMTIYFIGSLLFIMVEPHILLSKSMFEVASALGTVGLSMGITSELTFWGKLILILCMFVGRVGVITFGVSILAHLPRKEEKPKAQADIAL